jgi:DNA (cytosine-5)-methyltransferase 1
MEAVRIIKEMRNATKQLSMHGANDDSRVFPRVAIWENVPGAFSSNGGEDFRCVLEELARIENPEVSIPKPKKWGGTGWIDLPHGCITWRTHDAQYWGVPQRRKRISLVVDFRDKPEPEIQFISACLSGNPETSEDEREEITGVVGESADTAISFQERGGKPGGVKESSYSTTTQEHCQPSTTKLYCNSSGEEVSGTLDASYYKGCGERQGTEREVVRVGNGQLAQAELSEKVGALNCMHDQQAVITFSDTHNALNADDDPKGVHSQMMNAPEQNFVVSYGISSYDSNAMKSPNPNSGIYEAETSRTLDNNGGNPACNQGGDHRTRGQRQQTFSQGGWL